jgi:hypothetical protein
MQKVTWIAELEAFNAAGNGQVYFSKNEFFWYISISSIALQMKLGASGSGDAARALLLSLAESCET